MLVLAPILGRVGKLGRFLGCYFGDSTLLDAFVDIDLKTLPELAPYMVLIQARLYDMVQILEGVQSHH